ncbi:MAG TPA: long-chain-fatty-acid--CoA ligase, partial [Candidatus Acidoferrales bacterium]|nr:long-chain-fatty-acid--CoA ligase [Candidatus Acidoferrales bacterium]
MKTPLTPLEFMRRARRLYGEREAVVDGDVRLTYEQFFDRCDRWGAAMQGLGIVRGDRVAYIAPNTRSQLESFYAVPTIGAVLVPVNYRLSVAEFAYIINHSGARMVCVHSDYAAAVDSIRAQIPGVEFFVALGETAPAGWIDYEATIASASAAVVRADVGEDDLITINYTSGTTANPKGVMITHRNAYMNVVGTLIHMHMTPDDRYLWTLPMFHANGWTFVWTVTACGGTHVCLDKVEASRIFELINQERVTFLCAAPTVLIMIASAHEDVRRGVRRGVRVLTAGAPPAAATIELIEDEFGWEVTHIYGLTETSPFITICEPLARHADLSRSDLSDIKARTGVEMVTSGELVIVDDDGNEVPHDGETVGEIVVRGNVVMEGYYHDEEATATAFRGGYFHTGDAAVVHPDGYMQIRDRIKDVIISGGENISSIEVEGILLRHPAVHEVAVVGLPDEKWGESPHAFVVLAEGASVEPEALRDFVREHIARFKVPKAVHFVDELPKTA